MNDAELARNYILDKLSDEDRDECERRFLFEPEFEAAMLEQERALLDDYVHSRLSGEDAEAVLRRAAQTPGQMYRLRIAEGLKDAAEKAADTEVPVKGNPWAWGILTRRTFVWTGGAAVAAAALVAAITVSTHHRETPASPAQTRAANQPSAVQSNQDKEKAVSQPAAQPKTAQLSMATFVLLANEQRGDDDTTPITLKAGTDVLRLQLTTQEGLDPGRYSVVVADAHGACVFSAAQLSTRIEEGRRYVDLRIPATKLASGDYAVNLAPEAASTPALSFRFTLTAGSDAR